MPPSRSSLWSQEDGDNDHISPIIRASHLHPHHRQHHHHCKNETFPLEASFFRRVDWQTQSGGFRFDTLEQQMQQTLAKALKQRIWDLNQSNERAQWRMAISKKQFRESSVHTFQQRHGHHHKATTFKCYANVDLPLDQVMECLYAETTIEYRDRCGFLFANSFLDGAVLQVIEHAQTRPEEPEEDQELAQVKKKKRTQGRSSMKYLGLHWAAFKSSSAFVKNRDFCFARRLGYTSAASSASKSSSQDPAMGFVVLQSIDLDECPNLEKQLGLVRAGVCSVLLCRPSSDQKSTTLVWQGNMEFGGLASSGKALGLVHELFASAIANLRKTSELRQLRATTHLNTVERNHWVPETHVKSCYLCHRKFNFLRTKRRCQVCDEVMCSKCEVVRDLDQDIVFGLHTNHDVTDRKNSKANNHPPPPLINRFCKRCVMQVRQEAERRPFSRTSENRERAPSNSMASTLLQSDNAILLTANNLSGNSRDHTNTNDSNQSTEMLDAGDFTNCGVDSEDAEEATIGANDDIVMNKRPKTPQTTSRRASARENSTNSGNYYYPKASSEYAFEEDEEVDVFDMPHSNPHHHRNTSYETREENLALAMRLWEMNCKAQEALETTKRNSLMMSDTGSARGSESGANATWDWRESLDRNIAMQSDLLYAMAKGKQPATKNNPDSLNSSGSSQGNKQSRRRYSVEPSSITRSYCSEPCLSPSASPRFEYIG